jgi:ATP-binding cassette, subfamily B, bacterial
MNPPQRGRRLHALWRLRGYVRPHAGQMAAMVAASLLGVGAAIVVPLVAKAVVDGPVAHQQRRGLLLLGLLALGLGVAEASLIFARRWIQASAALGIETRIRDDLYRHLQRLPVAFHDRWQSGQLLSRATTDLAVIRRFVGFGLVFLIVNLATSVTVVGLLLRLDAPLGLLVASSAVPLLWLSARFERGYATVSRQVQDQQGDLTTVVEEAATGIRVIKSFGRRDLVGQRFAASAHTLYGFAMDSVRLRARFWTMLDLIPNLTLALVLLLGALAVGRQRLTLGGLVAFISLELLLVWPIEALGYILATAREAATAAERLYEVLDTPPTVTDRPGARRLARAHGRLRFERVGFRYPGSDRPVLRDVDLEVAPGETVALVGPTGSGKTTLAMLVARLYDVTDGRITLDGHDLRDLQLASLRRLVATAFEEPILFSASVRENVLLGAPTAGDDQLDAALALAQAGFVHQLPWGLDTRVGEQGMSLSGGQRQRLALARAVVGQPRVLVLDDPLSALDVHTEALVEQALEHVLAGTTALLVAHRPSTLALADRVALLDHGTIAAVGGHHELLDTVPAYRAILSQEADTQPTARAG